MSAPANSSPRLASVEAASQMARIAQAPIRFGHSVRILRDGALAFPTMLAMIRAAKRSICFENFIMAHDSTGEQFAGALERARKRGVEIRVLYDPIGTLLVRGGPVARRLKRADIEARAFRPLSLTAPWSWLRLRHRDHRKLLVVDEAYAVVGGLCIADHWAPAEKGGGGWRDTALLVRGPAVSDLRLAFERMWRRAHGPVPDTTRTLEAPLPGASEPRGEATVMVLGDRPGTGRVASLYEWLADHAEETFELTDAYFVAPSRVLDALIRAARRGVRVSLLLPGRNNHPVAGLAARRIYAPLLEAGAEVHEWGGVMLHAKTAVVDGVATLVGSSNLDPLSLTRNYELNLLVLDPATGAAMRELFASDIAHASRVGLEDWRRRPLLHRWAENAASWFSAFL